MEKMKTPSYLQKGDLLDLVAPSFGCVIEPYATRMEASIKRLKREGYRIREGVNIRRADGVVSSAPAKERAEEFMEAYLSPDSKAVISVGGGELMCEMLSYIDFFALKSATPKWFMGFSDNANLTFLLPILCGVKAIYGPNLPSFYEKPFRFAQLDALRALSGESHFEGYPKYFGKSNKDWPALYKPRANKEKKIIATRYEKPVEGMLLGGCLDVLENLMGTPFDKVAEFVEKQDSVIWFFEACDLNGLSIRRALWRMKEAGWFKNASMLLFGRHLAEVFPHNDFMGVNPISAVEVLDEYDLPMLQDIDLGHLGPAMPLITGAKAKVSYENGNILIDYEEEEA